MQSIFSVDDGLFYIVKFQLFVSASQCKQQAKNMSQNCTRNLTSVKSDRPKCKVPGAHGVEVSLRGGLSHLLAGCVTVRTTPTSGGNEEAGQGRSRASRDNSSPKA